MYLCKYKYYSTRTKFEESRIRSDDKMNNDDPILVMYLKEIRIYT